MASDFGAPMRRRAIAAAIRDDPAETPDHGEHARIPDQRVVVVALHELGADGPVRRWEFVYPPREDAQSDPQHGPLDPGGERSSGG
ncbi:MAG TPA: hypothetical protein VKB17_09000 [Thermoleophilaceae bacterium]|nr:hypothetical protein [Thermoleophilaceae bacterium]